MTRRQGLVAGLSGVVALIAIWAWAAANQPPYVLPGPVATVAALGDLARDGRLWFPLGLSLLRSFGGLAIACLIGGVWGALAGLSSAVDAFTRSWLALLMSVPPIVLVVIGMLAFGPTATVVGLVVVLVTLPLLATTTRDAIARVDADLLEMARAFGKPGGWRWRHVIAPAILPPILSALTVAAGQSLRVTVMAELLATSTGMGAQIQLARNNLETADVFAYALVLALVTACLELLLLAPMRRKTSLPNEPQRQQAQLQEAPL